MKKMPDMHSQTLASTALLLVRSIDCHHAWRCRAMLWWIVFVSSGSKVSSYYSFAWCNNNFSSSSCEAILVVPSNLIILFRLFDLLYFSFFLALAIKVLTFDVFTNSCEEILSKDIVLYLLLLFTCGYATNLENF